MSALERTCGKKLSPSWASHVSGYLDPPVTALRPLYPEKPSPSIYENPNVKQNKCPRLATENALLSNQCRSDD